MATPGAVLGAVRERLVASTDLQTYVGVDGTASDPTAARVIVKYTIDTTLQAYPAVTLYQERAQLDPTITRTWNPGFVLVSCYSNRDVEEPLEMYEIISPLLHGKKTEVSSSILGVCVHEVVERDVRGPRWVEETSCWRLDILYRIRASVID